MKLPVQAPAVVRGSVSWPMRSLVGGNTIPTIEPSGSAVNCDGDTPWTCICDNGIATCCTNNGGCTTQSSGECKCNTGRGGPGGE